VRPFRFIWAFDSSKIEHLTNPENYGFLPVLLLRLNGHGGLGYWATRSENRFKGPHIPTTGPVSCTQIRENRLYANTVNEMDRMGFNDLKNESFGPWSEL